MQRLRPLSAVDPASLARCHQTTHPLSLVHPPSTPTHLLPVGLVRDATSPADQAWLQERFRIAARKRYQALLTAAELQRPSSPRRQADARQGAVDSPEAVAAYGRLEELCRAIMNELRADDQIRDARVLPGFVNLPDITALEYVNVSGAAWLGWLAGGGVGSLGGYGEQMVSNAWGAVSCSACPSPPSHPSLHLRPPTNNRVSLSTCARCLRGIRRLHPPRLPSDWWRRWASCKTL